MSSRSARTPQPADRLDLRELTGAREDGGRLQLQRAVDGRFTWRIDVHARRGASRLVLLLPSDEPPAPGTSELDADLFDDAHVAVLVGSIPASPEGDPVHELGDVLAHLTALVRDMCVLMGVDQSDVLVYGAGMAGCWALMLAIELDGACAVGDSPWLEISGDDVPGVPGATAERVLGDPAEASSGGQPVRLSVVDRMLEAKRIPPFLVLTDPDDLNFRGHVDLIGRPTELRDACLHVGTTRLEVRAAPAARAATPGDVARVVNCVLGQGWVTERRPDPTYRELVERATQSIRAVRFVRDAEDHARFARAREDLDLITKVNPSSDWPYLRLCSLLKSWTNTFSEDMLVAAQQAFARRQSLEAFIYCCRGIFANREVHQARAELEELIRRTEDPQVASVGRSSSRSSPTSSETSSSTHGGSTSSARTGPRASTPTSPSRCPPCTPGRARSWCSEVVTASRSSTRTSRCRLGWTQPPSLRSRRATSPTSSATPSTWCDPSASRMRTTERWSSQ
ncbi:hypothetical protein [Cellulomonas sp. ATA003]|uniref:hypothetical protein n=1 Tax=Cellulomonas sp. ATA003 TaxID=3073064 RepID=UPI002873A9D0|nr:hypothetical protein [Cellulomonas sp. ATA003]WNB85192.1 hypothetical protein REH70_16375 [Cellulomonas sp. ATA003]